MTRRPSSLLLALGLSLGVVFLGAGVWMLGAAAPTATFVSGFVIGLTRTKA